MDADLLRLAHFRGFQTAIEGLTRHSQDMDVATTPEQVFSSGPLVGVRVQAASEWLRELLAPLAALPVPVSDEDRRLEEARAIVREHFGLRA